MDNQYYVDEYVNSRGLSKATRKKVKVIFNNYSKQQGKTLHELLIEADTEEENGIRWKRRTLKIRLTSYMNYCKENMRVSSAREYLNTIKGFYTHHEIEIGKLPKWNMKNANISEPITAKDLPTKEMIRNALDVSNNVMRAIILTAASTGMTKSEMLRITIKQFLDGTYPYHKKDNIREAIQVMTESKAEIITVFRMRRSKNNKYFITFCSPEATREIINYLTIRDKRNKKYHRPLLTNEDKLFQISSSHYQDTFVELNKVLNLPRKGAFRQFRGHMLRKFHATQLEKHGMPRYLVKVLQGKSNGSVDDVYFFEDEETLRNEYIKALDGVLIFTEVKEVTKYSPEYEELQQKYQEKEAEVNQMDERLAVIEKLLFEIEEQPRSREEILSSISKKD